MFINRKEEMCPLCGAMGQEFEVPKTKACPACGTVFNRFGVIFALDNVQDELELN